MIEARSFTKAYGDFVAVKHVDFEVPAGAIAALVGPNGAGKTTTIRTLCGILQPTAGVIRVGHHNLANDPVGVKTATAYVPDDPPLFTSLTVWEHLMFTAQAYRLDDWESAATGWLEHFELIDKQDSLATELSRGMRQKVAIVCAAMRSPSVYLLDEPMTGLDPPSIRKFKETMRDWGRAGATLLVSSHLLSLVEDLCDHLVLMQKGEVLYSGKLDDVRRQVGRQSKTLEDIFFELTGDRSGASDGE